MGHSHKYVHICHGAFTGTMAADKAWADLENVSNQRVFQVQINFITIMN